MPKKQCIAQRFRENANQSWSIVSEEGQFAVIMKKIAVTRCARILYESD